MGGRNQVGGGWWAVEGWLHRWAEVTQRVVAELLRVGGWVAPLFLHRKNNTAFDFLRILYIFILDQYTISNSIF